MILITGAAGFIGINTVLSLNQQGIKDLILVDHFELEEKSKKLKLFQYHQSLLINDCEALLGGNSDMNIDLVIHLGAITDTTCDDSELLKKLNVDFSKKIWHYCSKNNIKLIYASSAATYGIGDKGFDDDETKINRLKPLNKYGKSEKIHAGGYSIIHRKCPIWKWRSFWDRHCKKRENHCFRCQ